jgi:hypothetical protein
VNQVLAAPAAAGRLLAAACLPLLGLGCGGYGSVSQPEAEEAKKVVSAEHEKSGPPRRLIRPADDSPQDVRAGASGEMTASAAVDLVWSAVAESLEFEPVLAVWVLDTSTSAQSMLAQSTARLQQHYRDRSDALNSGEVRDADAGLHTGIVVFGRDVSFLLEEPVSDVSAVCEALDATRVDNSEQEKTFTAVRTALDRYLPLREQHGWKLIVCVITDEAGDDWQQVDGLVADVKRNSLPVYVIGSPAPLGRIEVSTADARAPAGEKPAADWVPQRYGPESRSPELVAFEAITVGSEMRLIDSGFGPFGLEWLCRASGGGFVALRPRAVGGYVGLMTDAWPSPYVPRFARDVMARYTPDYLSESDYQALLNGNQAARALHAATKLPVPRMLVPPQMNFTFTNEAQLNADLTKAQLSAASVAPALKLVYDTLKNGELERPQLKSLRWQAGYDLAFGRTAIGKARADSYNAMLARLKRGLTFSNPGSSVWVLEGAEEHSESDLEKLAARGREYLERVVREHAGSPWAAMAERELATPSGWRWTER